MRHTHWLTALPCCLATTMAQAQETSFIDHLNMPIEIGLATSVGDAFDSGLYFKTCLEYRNKKNHGWMAALEYDEYDLGYHDYRIEGSNATEGTLSMVNAFVGGGYRWAFVHDRSRWDDTGVVSLGAMLQTGVSFASAERVTGTGPDYRLKAVGRSNFALKASLQLDYLFSTYFGIFIAASYVQPFGHQLMPSHDSGVVVSSVGITSFF